MGSQVGKSGTGLSSVITATKQVMCGLKLKRDQERSGGKRRVALRLVHAGRGVVKFGRRESQNWRTQDELAGLADPGWSSDAPSRDSCIGNRGNGPFFVGDVGRVAASDGDNQ